MRLTKKSVVSKTLLLLEGGVPPRSSTTPPSRRRRVLDTTDFLVNPILDTINFLVRLFFLIGMRKLLQLFSRLLKIRLRLTLRHNIHTQKHKCNGDSFFPAETSHSHDYGCNRSHNRLHIIIHANHCRAE